MDFIRYGSLKIQTYEIVGDEWMHDPPAKKGIYAFPRGYVETFLLGGRGKGSVQNGRWRYLRDDNGKKIRVRYEDFFSDEYNEKTGTDYVKEPYNTLLKRKRIPDNKLTTLNAYDKTRPVGENYKGDVVYILVENKPTKFKYNGHIWHHLDAWNETKMCSPGDIIRRSDNGKWILTTMKVYEKCLKRYVHMHKFFSNSVLFTTDGTTKLHRQARCDGYPMHNESKDEYEVFIEKL